MPNAAANSTEAGSGAGGTTLSVGAAPTALPAATAVPIPVKPDAASAMPTGNASTNIKPSPLTLTA
ncbi:hypothetical protein MMRN_p0180 (plasmid) [Mycobacterium marinum]|nr:hypothetical protein MMRN_p0180 [Mycobacterium marinum]